jgi:predicted nucleic-acid-binding Zn-ribbon protein
MAGLMRALLRPEYLRTCRACGYTWKVPKWYAKIHPGGMPRSTWAGSNDGYGKAFSTDRITNTVDSNAALAQDVARFRTCAKCGAHNNYAQQRIWHESKTDYEGSD